MSTLAVNLDLVRKYNVPGPRYTSYPPATQFKPLREPAIWEEEIRHRNQEPRNLSLYFHLPFCRSLCWYCGCTTVITREQNQSSTYLDYLAKELALAAPTLNEKNRVVQIHLGGGTPTFLRPDELTELGQLIREHFAVAPAVEAGVEIDPRRVTEEHIRALAEGGFNRASIGIQDFDPKVQLAVHRIQPREQVNQVVKWVREAGFKSINLDLIYGLPYQTVETFSKTLEATLDLRPDRLAVFSYAHVPWIKPAQKSLENHDLPSAETKLQLLKTTIETLTSAGYVYIGMDHFAREGDELALAQKQGRLQRNFQGYSTHQGLDIQGFGMSSISQAGDCYWQNEKELPAYYDSLNRGRLPLARGYRLTEDDRIRRQTIMRLMCDMGLEFEQMSREIERPFAEYFDRELKSIEDLELDGLLRRSPAGIEVTNAGRLFIRNIAMRFDPYLASTNRQFSKTV